MSKTMNKGRVISRLEDLVYQWNTIAELSDSRRESRAFIEAANDLNQVLNELFPKEDF